MDKLKSQFKVSDKRLSRKINFNLFSLRFVFRFWWLRIRALAAAKKYEELMTFAKSKKSPIGYEVTNILSCLLFFYMRSLLALLSSRLRQRSRQRSSSEKFHRSLTARRSHSLLLGYAVSQGGKHIHTYARQIGYVTNTYHPIRE